jgi:AmiR/NasT family two-component response regulator
MIHTFKSKTPKNNNANDIMQMKKQRKEVTMKKILIVEDEIIIVMDLTMRLSSMGFEVIGHAADSEKAVELALAEEPDLVIMDIFLEGQHDGIFAAEIISTEMDIPIVFLTSHSDSNTVNRAKKVLSYGYIVKPYSDRELKEKILLALECH